MPRYAMKEFLFNKPASTEQAPNPSLAIQDQAWDQCATAVQMLQEEAMWALSDAKQVKDSLLRSHQKVLEGSERMEQTVMEALVLDNLLLLGTLLLLVLISELR